MYRKIRLLSTLTLLVWNSFESNAQKSIMLPSIAEKLNTIAKKMMDLGIYERTANFGYVPSPDKFDHKSISAHNEFTMWIMRFDQMKLDTSSNTYIGRVFMGERYLEVYYNKKYSGIGEYRNDKDGFFMTCKLFYEPRTGEFRVNIYPDYVTNICTTSTDPLKGMHYNTEKCKSSSEHWASLRYLAAIKDEHYDDFSKTNDSVNVFHFLKYAGPSVNMFKQDTSYSDLPKRKKSLLRELNLRKQIKCFTVENLNGKDNRFSADVLRLKFTKYPLSEDFIDGAEYEFKRLSFNEMDSSFLRLRSGIDSSVTSASIFITRNPLYYSLISSPEPYDSFVPELSLEEKGDIYFMRNEILQNSSVLKGKSDAENLESDRLIYEKQKNQVSNKPDIDQGSYQKTLDKLRGKALAITSPKKGEDHWIFYDSNLQNGIVNKIIKIKSPVFLRDTIPTINQNEWLLGGIKVRVNEGVTNEEDVWEVLESVIYDGGSWKSFDIAQINKEKPKYLWIKIRKPKVGYF